MRTSLDTPGTLQPLIHWSSADAHPLGDDRIELGQWSRHQQHLAHWTITALLVAAMLLLGSAWAQAATAPEARVDHGPYPAGAQPADSAITVAVENELLRDDAVFPDAIDVTTSKGIVTLAGSVNNLLAQERVVSIAESLRGVRGVISLVTVTPVMRPDEDIRKDILNALLEDPATDSYTVQAAVHNAVVMLTGSVGTFGEKKLVERIAKGIKGVSEIHNNVTIAYLASRTSAEMAGDITDRLQWDIWLNGDRLAVTMKDGAATLTGTVGTVREFWRAFEDAWVDGVTAVDISALKVDPAERDEARRKMAFAIKSDGEITKAVLAAFHQDPRLKGSSPEVSVEDGEVVLRGSVGNMKAKSSAEQDARNTVGVGSIECLLKVKPKEHLSDPDIAAQLKSALFADPLLGDYSIVVAVVNHVAVLSGTVDSRFQKAEAQDVATRTKGVTMISNRLKIQPEFSSLYAEPLNSDPYPYLITEIYDATPFLSDDQLRVHIEHGLSWCPDVGWGEVKVTAVNGVVTLGGTLKTWLGRNEADRVALQCGAHSVINHIDVEKGGWWW
jgi:osmotically-inducible protein OsmY